MTHELITNESSLDELAARIREEHDAVSVALYDGLRHARAAGMLLIEAKKLVPHGEWLPWLKANCGTSERTAQAYMKVAKANPQRVADLSFREALNSLATPSSTKTSCSSPKPPKPVAAAKLAPAVIDPSTLSMTAQEKLAAAIRHATIRLEVEIENRLRAKVLGDFERTTLPHYLNEIEKLYGMLTSMRNGVMPRASYENLTLPASRLPQVGQ